MVESYSVETVLTLKDELTPGLERAGKMAADLAKILSDLSDVKPFAGMGGDATKAADSFLSMSKSLGNITKGFDSAVTGADALSDALSSIGNSSGLSNVTAQVNELAAAEKSAAAAVREMQEANSIAVNQRTSNRQSAPANMSAREREYSNYSHVGMNEDENEAWLGRNPYNPPPEEESAGPAIQRNTHGNAAIDMMISGAMIEEAGRADIDQIKEFYEAGKGYQQSYSGFRALNLGEVTDADANEFATNTDIKGVTQKDLMDNLGVLHTVLGNYNEAKDITPFISQMEFANRAVFQGKVNFDQSQATAMAKVIEMRGGFRSEEEMKTQADYMQHVASGTSGLVMPKEYLAFMKTAGIAGRLQDNETFYYQMEPLIQEMTGTKVGTGLQSAYQNLAQGRSATRAARELERLGLINKDKDGKEMAGFDTHGRLVSIMPGGVKNSEDVVNPLKYLQETLLPAFAKAGITDPKDIQNELATILGNRTAANVYSLVFSQMDKIVKNMKITKDAMGIEDVEREAGRNITGAEQMATASYEKFATALGNLMMPSMINGLHMISDAFDSVTDWVRKNPDTAKTILEVATALGTFAVIAGSTLIFAGTLGMLATALGGPWVWIIVGLAAGLTALGVALFDLNKPLTNKGNMSQTAAEHAQMTDDGHKEIFGQRIEKEQIELAKQAFDIISKFTVSYYTNILSGFIWFQKEIFNIGDYVGKNLVKIGMNFRASEMAMMADISAFGLKVWEGFKSMLTNLGDMIVEFVKTIPSLALKGLNAVAQTNPQIKAAEDAYNYVFGKSEPKTPIPTNESAKAAFTGANAQTAKDAPFFKSADETHAIVKELIVQLKNTQKPVIMQIDAKKIGEAVLALMNAGTGGPSTGPSTHDQSRHYIPPGLTLSGQN